MRAGTLVVVLSLLLGPVSRAAAQNTSALNSGISNRLIDTRRSLAPLPFEEGKTPFSFTSPFPSTDPGVVLSGPAPPTRPSFSLSSLFSRIFSSQSGQAAPVAAPIPQNRFQGIDTNPNNKLFPFTNSSGAFQNVDRRPNHHLWPFSN